MEVAGRSPLPPHELAELLRVRLGIPPGARLPFRILRTRGRRALIALPAREVPQARRALHAPGATPGSVTYRTWGTLRKAKEWLDFPRGRTAWPSGDPPN